MEKGLPFASSKKFLARWLVPLAMEYLQLMVTTGASSPRWERPIIHTCDACGLIVFTYMTWPPGKNLVKVQHWGYDLCVFLPEVLQYWCILGSTIYLVKASWRPHIRCGTENIQKFRYVWTSECALTHWYGQSLLSQPQWKETERLASRVRVV